MTIATYLNQKFLSSNVQVFLYEDDYVEMIADTTVEVLQLSTKETFRSLEVVADFKHNDKYIVMVVKPQNNPKIAPKLHF